MVQITLAGSDALIRELRKMPQEIQDAASRAVMATALEMRGDAVKRIQRGPNSGRVYRKYNPSRMHQASAPGQAPASDTGRLANSITFDQIDDLTATVGSRLAYAVHLEYGTTNMAARPYFRPAVNAAREKFNARLEAAILGAIR